MISRAALVPHPPLLVPELVTGAAAETEPLRTACVGAARELTEVSRDWLAIAVDPDGPTLVPSIARGTFLGYGVDVGVGLADTADTAVDPDLPLPALIAGWLREQAGARTVRVQLLPPDLSVADCLDIGADLAADPLPMGLLVLAEGPNRIGAAAPARPDDRAEPFDEDLRTALGKPDPAAIAAIDPALATELGVVGRPALQVLAGIALAGGEPWQARELYSAAPYGIGYHVAVWDPS
ncbi:MAG TPA: hypothetical protein VGM75_19940 [Pseudonocardiaceae bacterium]